MSESRPPDEVGRADVFASVATEAGALYKQLVTIATIFLGGTLVFMHKIAPQPTVLSIVFLGVGWLALLLCVVLVVLVRADNIRSGRMVLESRFHDAKAIDSRNRRQTTAATVLLAVGLV